MAIYGYARVSTGRQASEGESLDVQRRQIEGYSAMKGWTLDAVFVEEGVSGSIPLHERPQGARLRGSLKAGDVLIAAKLDRLFRSALDALQATESLKQGGVHLHLIDLGGDIAGNGLSKLFLTIAAAFAEAERDRIRERVANTKADQRARGRYLGGIIPFGWRVDDAGGLVEDEGQQQAIRRIVALRQAGRSYRAIAEAMQAEGVRLTHEGVRKVLDRAGQVRGDRGR